MISHCGNRDVTNGGLEFDEGVGLIMRVRGASFAASTEVGIVTNSALVTVSLNIGLSTVALVAKRTITVDAMMTSLADI